MGDFWGIRNIFQDSNFSNGASLVLVQNEKGMEMIKNLDIYLKHIEEKKEALCFQSRLYSPTKKPSLREQFWRDYKLYDFSRILKKYFYYTNINKVKYFVKRTLCDCHFRKISDKLFKDIII